MGVNLVVKVVRDGWVSRKSTVVCDDVSGAQYGH